MNELGPKQCTFFFYVALILSTQRLARSQVAGIVRTPCTGRLILARRTLLNGNRFSSVYWALSAFALVLCTRTSGLARRPWSS